MMVLQISRCLGPCVSLWCLMLFSSIAESTGFTVRPPSTSTTPPATLCEFVGRQHVVLYETTKEAGDPLRAATGIRPSLHPVTINALAEALKRRASNDPDYPLSVQEGGPTPMDVVLAASNIAVTALQKRQDASDQDGMKLNEAESQTIAGRVVGVVIRFDALEEALREKVSAVEWVQKYNDWASFGVMANEKETDDSVQERIKDDPLFAVSRAECLLAIFLQTVEVPSLEKSGESVPDKSQIDFLDSDRKEVLLD